jgi:hypothetical protein
MRQETSTANVKLSLLQVHLGTDAEQLPHNFSLPAALNMNISVLIRFI